MRVQENASTKLASFFSAVDEVKPLRAAAALEITVSLSQLRVRADLRCFAAAQGHQVKTDESAPITVDVAVERYLEDKRQQNCAEETLTKLSTYVSRHLRR